MRRRPGKQRAAAPAAAAAPSSAAPCTHPVVVSGLCASCGAAAAAVAAPGGAAFGGAAARQKVAVRGAFGAEVSVGTAEAAAISLRGCTRLLERRLLSLVIDLDHTLVHATVDEKAGALLAAGVPGVCPLQLPRETRAHFLKTRVGLADFLHRAARVAELTIYTHGSRAYAGQVVATIDPTGAYFGQGRRVVSRDDCPDLYTDSKSLARIFPGGVALALVLDDREDVWPGQVHRELLVKPYQYFVGLGNHVREEFQALEPPAAAAPAAPAAAASDAMSDEDDAPAAPAAAAPPPQGRRLLRMATAPPDVDAQLGHSLAALEAVHAAFYARVDALYPTSAAAAAALLRPAGGAFGGAPDAGALLSAARKQVLAGCVLVFTGVLPRGATVDTQPLLRWAVACGATVHADVTARTTHVVTDPGHASTEKARRGAAQPGVFVLHVDWLWYCVWHVRREAEAGSKWLLHPVCPGAPLAAAGASRLLEGGGAAAPPAKRMRCDDDLDAGPALGAGGAMAAAVVAARKRGADEPAAGPAAAKRPRGLGPEATFGVKGAAGAAAAAAGVTGAANFGNSGGPDEAGEAMWNDLSREKSAADSAAAAASSPDDESQDVDAGDLLDLERDLLSGGTGGDEAPEYEQAEAADY